MPKGDAFEHKTSKRNLFATKDPNILAFLDFSSIDEAEFLSLLISAEPKFVLDVRQVPRFDVGNLNRKLVFSIFKKAGAKYIDLGALIGPAHMREIADDPADLSRLALDRAFGSPGHVTGPIIVIIDAKQNSAPFIDEFALGLDPANRLGWETLRIPAVSSAKALGNRSTIFISHATPDDNSFVQWLSSQLVLSGYEVWTDFERLEGGELFWDTIEDVIRNRAAKVIVAASGLAQTRPGVLDELNLALSVERSLGLSQFVIPLRIDSTPFSEFRANISRRNILNFDGNWAAGLTELLKVLETDRVPVDPSGVSGEVGRQVHERIRAKKGTVDVPDTLMINWVQVLRWPSAINALSFPSPASRQTLRAGMSQVPNAEFNDQFLSFANANQFTMEWEGRAARSDGSIVFQEFIGGRWKQFPNLSPFVAKRILSNLTRQSWERTARKLGLSSFQLASRANCWFLSKDLLPGNKIQFQDHEGKRKTKTLVGHSKKRGVYWHFAVELKPLVNHPETLVIKPHVIFSEDGKIPIDSSARMHALRRGFCKSWWNDRWRDLTAAFLAFLNKGEDVFELDTCGDPIVVSGHMGQLVCPVSPDESVDVILTAEDDLDEDDPDIQEEEIGFANDATAEGEQS